MDATVTDFFVYKGNKVKAEFFEIKSKDTMPNLPWKQVYAICNLSGEVPVVFYADGHFSLPGGTTELGESVSDTLCREIEEELNCRVISWTPLGYQKNTLDGVSDGYQLRVYAVLEKIGDFKADPAGSVIGYKLIGIDDLSRTIKWGKMSDHIQQLAKIHMGYNGNQ